METATQAAAEAADTNRVPQCVRAAFTLPKEALGALQSLIDDKAPFPRDRTILMLRSNWCYTVVFQGAFVAVLRWPTDTVAAECVDALGELCEVLDVAVDFRPAGKIKPGSELPYHISYGPNPDHTLMLGGMVLGVTGINGTVFLDAQDPKLPDFGKVLSWCREEEDPASLEARVTLLSPWLLRRILSVLEKLGAETVSLRRVGHTGAAVVLQGPMLKAGAECWVVLMGKACAQDDSRDFITRPVPRWWREWMALNPSGTQMAADATRGPDEAEAEGAEADKGEET